LPPCLAARLFAWECGKPWAAVILKWKCFSQTIANFRLPIANLNVQHARLNLAIGNWKSAMISAN
jgi:hypothetical protein